MGIKGWWERFPMIKCSQTNRGVSTTTLQVHFKRPKLTKAVAQRKSNNHKTQDKEFVLLRALRGLPFILIVQNPVFPFSFVYVFMHVFVYCILVLHVAPKA